MAADVQGEAPPRWMSVAPHALSFARVVLVALTYLAAWREDRAWFTVLVLLAVLTDILDGPLARVSGSASRFGANVDSAADFMFYMSLPVWTWMFRPDVILTYLPLIIVLSVLYAGANFISHATFGALGVHNRLSRASGTVGVAFAFYVILAGVQPLFLTALLLLMSADLAQRYGAVWRELRERRAAAKARDT